MYTVFSEFSTTCDDCIGHEVSACALGCNLHYNYFNMTLAHLKHLNTFISDKIHGEIRQTGLLQTTIVWCSEIVGLQTRILKLIRSPSLLSILDNIVNRLVLGYLQLSGFMMTSSNGNIFRVTGPLWRESTGDRWLPLTKASDAELWCFLWYCAWTNAWTNNRDAGDLRRNRAHYNVIVTL